MNLFIFDNSVNEVMINEPEVLLVREFAELWKPERNKTKADPKGTKRKLAYKLFTYIWLMCDWKSPYADYSELERHLEALTDSGLTEDDWNNPEFRAACRKYRELQESSRSLKLIRSALGVADKLIDYFDTVDLQERDPMTGKPVFKAKDVMTEMSNVSGTIELLKTLEYMYKKEMEETGGVMGDVELGYSD